RDVAGRYDVDRRVAAARRSVRGSVRDDGARRISHQDAGERTDRTRQWLHPRAHAVGQRMAGWGDGSALRSRTEDSWCAFPKCILATAGGNEALMRRWKELGIDWRDFAKCV